MARLETIWAVDDSPLEGMHLTRVLEPHFEVATFTTGAALLEALAYGTRPAVALVDVHMPDMGGIEVCRFVRGLFDASQLPVIMVTASADRSEMLDAFQAGANDFVRKPFDSDELRARIACATHRRRMHEEMSRAQQVLREEAGLRERFVGILGHDLRQPLNAFLVGTQTLGRSSLDERQRRTVRILEEAARRMNRLVRDVLDLTLARVGGGLPLNATPHDMHETLRAVVSEFQTSAPTHAFQLTVAGAGRGSWDRDRMMQVWTNLLANAVAYGTPSTPIVIEARDHGEEVIEIVVSNRGPAIPLDQQATLFDAFQRGGTTAAGGLGLGLFIVRAIVEAHGGTVSVASDEDRTSFSVRVPRVPAPSSRGARLSPLP